MIIFLFKSYSQARRQSHVRVVLAQDQLYIDEPYFVPNICQVAESAISLRPCTGVRKERHTIQVQNKEDLRNGELNIIQRRNETDHDWYLRKQGQRKPDYTLEGAQHPMQDGESVFSVTCR